MANISKSQKSAIKFGFLIVLSLIPIANIVALMLMSSNTGYKKWRTIAWVMLVVLIVGSIGLYVCMGIAYEYPAEYEYDRSSRPDVEDYFEDPNYSKYYNGQEYPYTDPETGYIYEGYMYTPEYKQYEKDAEAWDNQPEIVEKDRLQRQWTDVFTTIGAVLYVVIGVLPIATFFIILSDRRKYLELVAEQNKTQQAGSLLNASYSGNPLPGQYYNQQGYAVNNTQPTQPIQPAQPVQPVQPTQPVQPVYQQNAHNPATAQPVQQYAPVGQPIPVGIDVNNASEEEIATLPGVTIIDSKKAVAYREKNGGFRNIDEFYGCINAKPHIIANIMNSVYVGAPVKPQTSAAPSNPKRTLDI